MSVLPDQPSADRLLDAIGQCDILGIRADGCDPNSRRGSDNMSALHFATTGGDLAGLELVTAGAAIHERTPGDMMYMLDHAKDAEASQSPLDALAIKCDYCPHQGEVCKVAFNTEGGWENAGAHGLGAEQNTWRCAQHLCRCDEC